MKPNRLVKYFTGLTILIWSGRFHRKVWMLISSSLKITVWRQAVFKTPKSTQSTLIKKRGKDNHKLIMSSTHFLNYLRCSECSQNCKENGYQFLKIILNV